MAFGLSELLLNAVNATATKDNLTAATWFIVGISGLIGLGLWHFLDLGGKIASLSNRSAPKKAALQEGIKLVTKQDRSVTIGGDNTGNVIIGDGNTVNELPAPELKTLSKKRTQENDGRFKTEIQFELASKVVRSALIAIAPSKDVEDFDFSIWTGMQTTTKGSTDDGRKAIRLSPATPGRYVVRYTSVKPEGDVEIQCE